MRAVLDASVAVKWVLPEPDTPKAVRLRNEFRLDLHDLLAPDIFPLELAHAMTRAERTGTLRHGLALPRLAVALKCMPDLRPHLPLLPAAAALASRYRVAVNDCLYVVLADREGIPLVTADRRLINGLGPTHPFIMPLASLP